jgi:hypothetical protein
MEYILFLVVLAAFGWVGYKLVTEPKVEKVRGDKQPQPHNPPSDNKEL